MSVKICARCKQEFPLESFRQVYKDRDDKRISYCPKCDKTKKKEDYQRNRDAALSRTKRWREKNAEKYDEYQREYKEQNKNYFVQYSRNYRAENGELVKSRKHQKYIESAEEREKVRERNKRHKKVIRERMEKDPEYAKARREHFNKIRAVWREANRDLHLMQSRLYSAKRRARMSHGMEELPAITTEFLAQLLETQKGLCIFCGATLTEETQWIEHIIAVSVGGLHEPQNVVWSCRRCNLSKGKKMLYSEWIPPLDKNSEGDA